MSKRDDVVIEAVNSLKNSEFGVTGIKIELEAQIDREDDAEEIHQHILEELEPLGLARRNVDSSYETKVPLVYAQTYNDGSVDTELTFTLSLDDPAVVFKLPRILEIFKEVCAHHGNEFYTHNAGMHIALLNDKDCKYDPNTFKRIKPYDGVRFKNFSRSMIRLLPALYFLGSWNKESRALEFRRPQIRSCNVPTNHRYDPDSQKYSAVAFRHGAVEFRIFETCYDKPEVVLDNIVVMANAMNFWTRKYTRNNLKRMPGIVKFGHNNGDGLSRLFTVEQHIDLLNAGLKILKPRYYTIADLRKQRNFNVTKTSIRNNRRQIRLQAVEDYKKYEIQHDWRVIYEEQDAIRQFIENVAFGGKHLHEPKDKVLAMARKEGKLRAEQLKNQKDSKSKFVKDTVDSRLPKAGNYELIEEEPAPRPRRQTERIMFEDIVSTRMSVNHSWPTIDGTNMDGTEVF